MVAMPCAAQIHIYAKAGAGSYSMGGLKKFQKDLVANFDQQGLPAEAVLKFPPSLQFEAGFDWAPDPDEPIIGGFVNYAPTSGRVLYRDYSGEAYIDLDVRRWAFGGRASNRLGAGFGLYLKIGICRTAVDLISGIKIGDFDSEEETTECYSVGFVAEPGVSWGYDVNRFRFMTNIGGELNVQGKTRLKEDHKVYLTDSGGGQVLANWSGVRAAIGVGFRLTKEEDSK